MAGGADSLDFGLLGIGEVAMRRLRIWNPGTVPVVVTVPSNRGGFFSWQALPATTVPSQSGIDLDVEFSPLGSGTARGVLTVEDTAQGSPHTIALSGRGRQETPN
jgi:hypothetical protein